MKTKNNQLEQPIPSTINHKSKSWIKLTDSSDSSDSSDSMRFHAIPCDPMRFHAQSLTSNSPYYSPIPHHSNKKLLSLFVYDTFFM